MNNKKKTILTLLALIITVLTGCRDNAHVNEIFQQADSLMADHPDSAYTMLLAMEPEVQACPKGQQMRYELLRAKAQNKAFVDFTTDSIMLLVADYYDHHGTPNDRLMAHYLLGCTYRDLGEAPRAIDSYQTAVECADTTDANCDFITLGCVYSQMADIYSMQLLVTNELQCRSNAYKFSVRTSGFKGAAYELCMIGCNYIILNKLDSAEIFFHRAKEMYEANGFHQEWVERSSMLAHLYLSDTPKLQQAEEILNIYEKESIYLNGKGELPPLKRKFFGYKGILYEKKNQLDSAEYYIRKVGDEYKEMMYCSLLHIYQQRHDADSIAKYAQLYCEANDSSIAITDREITAKMTASYNYNRYLKEANIQHAKAARNAIWLIVSISITLFIIIVSFIIIRNYRRRRIEKQRELDLHMQEYAETCEQLNNLRSQMEQQKRRDTTLIHVLQDTLVSTKDDTAKQRAKNAELRKEIELLREQYEEYMQVHSEKCKQLQSKLDILIQHGAMRIIEEKAKAFTENEAAQHIISSAFDTHVSVTEQEWEDIISIAQAQYPKLMHELALHTDITMQALRVAVLLLLSIPPAGIANIMGVQQQRITNIKSTINQALFHDKSARTLLANIGKKYAIYPKYRS